MDRDLRAFLAVARAGNLTLAADRIGLTQPALTKTIRRLEISFKTKLFRRTSRGMALTDDGALLLARAGLIETHYRQAQEEIAAKKAGALAEFRVAAGTAYHAAIAPKLLRRLSEAFPQTRFSLSFEVAQSSMPKLVDGDLDLMLGAFISTPLEGIETVPLFPVEIGVFCGKRHPLAGRRNVRPIDLLGAEWISYQRDRPMRHRLESFYTDHLMPAPRIAMEVDSLTAAFQIVSETSYLVAGATMLEPTARSLGVVRAPMKQPIWRFMSGAWLRSSLRNVPLMQQALAQALALAKVHALHSAAE